MRRAVFSLAVVSFLAVAACSLSSGLGGYTSCSDDLQSDAKNCGECGHECVGGTCSAGQCVATAPTSPTGSTTSTSPPAGIDATTGADTSTPSVVDTGIDTSIADTGMDTGIVDTGIDTSIVDTGIDTSIVDTGIDTSIVDTGTDTSSPDTGTDANCGDTLSNPFNCGTCGHDCLGGACANGQCKPALVANIGFISPAGIEIVGSTIYVSQFESPGVIRRFGIDGDAGTDLITNLVFPAHMGYANGLLYVTEATSGHVSAINVNTGQLALLVGGANRPVAVTVANNTMYVAEQPGDPDAGGVRTYNLSGGGGTRIYGPGTTVEGLTVVSGHLLVCDQTKGTVESVPALTSHPAVPGAPAGITSDGDEVWVAGQGSGNIYHFFLSQPGLGVQIIANDPGGPTGIRATPNAVYWVDYSSQKLMRLAR